MSIERKAVPRKAEPSEGATCNDANLNVQQVFQFNSLYYHGLRGIREELAQGHRKHKKTLDKKLLWKYAKVSASSGLPRLLFRTDGPYRDRQPYNRAPRIDTELFPKVAEWQFIAVARALAEIAAEDFSMSPIDQGDQKAKAEPEPEEVSLNIVLWSTQALFESRTALPDRTFEKVLDTGKKILRKTQDDSKVRQTLGANPTIWKDLFGVFNTAIPIIEQQFFGPDEAPPANSTAAQTSSMTPKDSMLMKDLERLNDLLTIARNMLATTKRAQNLAGDSGLDQQVLKLIDICVRVTARAYEGEEPGRRTENQLTLLSGSFKKTLITSLQFLHNFVMHNEKRKLLLWLDLFANSKPVDQYFDGTTDVQQDSSALKVEHPEVIIRKEFKCQSDADRLPLDVEKIMSTALNAVRNSTKGAYPLPPDEAARLTSQVKSTVDSLYTLTLERAFKTTPEGQQGSMSEPLVSTISAQITGQGQHQSLGWTSLPDPSLYGDDPRVSNPKIEELKPMKSPESAAASLQSAKDQLMARLQDPASGFGNEDAPYQGSEQDNGGEPEGSDIAANGSVGDEADDADGDYRGPGDQERGLLTDIPLVLAPQEIEALPMIIQAGIVSNGPGTKVAGNKKESQDMQGVRCNILLAQETGRNLLRELLIFIAAWDLQDNEFYFKLMMQIMDAILENGLMPFAYQAFGEIKDIVSPAQSMVIKILTQIFRGKQGMPPSSNGPAAPTRHREPLTRVDSLIVRYIFTIFRQCIIPETCALIYLQGQIRAGTAQPDDFPLNLWDMERVYEGVYQFLEFFAVLTESEDWKGYLVDWQIVSELVTLLRELDASIPKAPLGVAPPTAADSDTGVMAETSGRDNAESQAAHPPVAVERPYDMPAPSEPPVVPATASAPYSVPPSPPLDAQEPSDFEWRNLKKLVVLVLSSLVWKSTTVQDQIRKYGGVQMILQCCKYDSNNPYIREHAIMCLRFLLEGNGENQAIVENLEAQRTVPDEVLDKRGYETYIDNDGKVGLRARERVVHGRAAEGQGYEG